jgi:hypothetical protein
MNVVMVETVNYVFLVIKWVELRTESFLNRNLPDQVGIFVFLNLHIFLILRFPLIPLIFVYFGLSQVCFFGDLFCLTDIFYMIYILTIFLKRIWESLPLPTYTLQYFVFIQLSSEPPLQSMLAKGWPNKGPTKTSVGPKCFNIWERDAVQEHE